MVPSLLKELYYRTKYRFSNQRVTYDLNGITTVFTAETYAEFRRFQSLMGEESVARDLLRELEPHDVFFDIGANVGAYACVAAQKLERGQVVAFEPEPSNADRLRENASLNDLCIDLREIALSDTAGTAHLKLEADTIGAGEHSLAVGQSGNTIEVAEDRGDTLVKRDRLPIPNVIKIDVEGAELKVVRGLAETLSHNDCRVVYSEIHPDRLREFGHRFEQLDQLLRDAGFSVHVMKRMGEKFFIKAEKPHAE